MVEVWGGVISGLREIEIHSLRFSSKTNSRFFGFF
jgi:hypothetical protein